MLVGIALIGQVIMVPAMIGQALSDPDQFLELRNLPAYMQQTFQEWRSSRRLDS